MTLASAWQAASGAGLTDELLEWPPAGAADWSDAVVNAGRDWGAWRAFDRPRWTARCPQWLENLKRTAEARTRA